MGRMNVICIFRILDTIVTTDIISILAIVFLRVRCLELCFHPHRFKILSINNILQLSIFLAVLFDLFAWFFLMFLSQGSIFIIIRFI